ncbi:MAG TPA: BatA domain-containing protein, partial [Roseiarcus sp.]|nr:BatA domain-containing protein [Roseiarcus sp.]
MFGLPLAFTAPAALVSLVLLGALYVFLRITPPRPRQTIFPPLRLLLGIDRKEQTPARTPWPLLALRLAIAAAAVIAMAGPMWNPSLFGGGSGPILMIVDDGWPAAPSWEARKALLVARLEAAAHDNRLVALLPVSQGGVDIAPAEAARNAERLRALEPQPYAPNHKDILPPIRKFLAQFPKAEIVWLADGLSIGETDSFAHELAGLANGHDASVLIDNGTALGLSSVENLTGALQAKVLRAGATARQRGALHALDAKGLTIGEAPFDFAAADTATATFDLPIELRNEVSRITIDNERSAGAVVLLDERWRKRRVAIASGVSVDVAQPLLSPTYYLSRAIGPFADLREWRDSASDPIVSLIGEKPSVVMLADMSVAGGPAHDALTKFVDEGGVLVRFAGSRLAASADDLTPTELRRGGRTLGGALSWETPKKLAAFDRDSPFFGLTVPEEVTVSRQVLAEPEPGLANKTWARLADGTPLVTADRRGKGVIVLFHVTADTTWSNLPLSGLFVDMLRRIVALAAQSAPEAEKDAKGVVPSRPPKSVLDGYGALGAPPASAQPIAADFAGPADAAHPPGFYGTGEALTAVNTLPTDEALKLADYAGLPVKTNAFAVAAPLDLRLWLLTAAFIGLLIDVLASLWIGGAL